MANRKVSIWKYVRTAAGWKYCKPATGRNNKLRPDYVRVGNRGEHHPEGAYYIRWREKKKIVWRKCESANDAVKMAEFQESYLRAVSVGVKVDGSEKPPLMVSDTLQSWLKEYKLSVRPESYALMKQTLDEFFGYEKSNGARVPGFTRKNIVSQITRFDLLQYKQFLVDHRRSERTAGNKMMRVNQYLKSIQGLKAGQGLITSKDAKWVEKEPEVYTETELEKFFKHCEPFHFAVFKTLLMSGLRKQEMESLTWDDVDFESGLFKVRAKEGFKPKTWEERTIEVPKELLDILNGLPRISRWIFCTKRGTKYTHVWDDCRTISKKAGVVGAHPHKFRSTYATTLLQNGVDLKTVQRLLGHKNLESTMRYLARAQSHVVKAKVNAIWAGK